MLKQLPRYIVFQQEKLSQGFSKNIKYFYGGLFVLIFFVPLLPFTSNYFIHLCTYVMMYIILSLGLNILPGFTGLLDLGYVGFYGIGAYTAGLLTLKCAALGPPWDILASYWIVIPIAAINGALSGILLGAPTLRLTGDYFAIVTFGFSELVVLIIINEMWLTRGPMGLPGIPPPSFDLTFLYPITHFIWPNPIRYVFRGELPFYYLILVMVVGTVIVMNRLENSRVGRAWLAIREDEVAAECSGINIMKYKVIAFAISASFGAIAGSFFARWYSFISPVSFKFWESILILCMVVLGGMGSIPGVILGATCLISLSEVLRKVLEPWPNLVQARYALFGIILIVMMRFKPAGLIPISRVKREMGPHDRSIVEAMNESFYTVTHDEEQIGKQK
jgi:branched-chain amino acid transport system permease protein